MWVSIHRILRSALVSFRRNGWLTLAAIFIMTQALLIISIFASLNVVIGSSIQAINERLDVTVFFRETAPPEEVLALREQVLGWEKVKEVIYVSPQEALDKFLAEHRNRAIIRDVVNVEENFLPASLEIKVSDPYAIESIIKRILQSSRAKFISETSLEDNQQLIAKLRDLGSFIQRSSLFLALIFVVIAILIIFNTIRITIFTRREEIEIMKLVGATDWYIRWPFIVEGMLYGLMAIVFTFVLLYGGYLVILKPLVENYLITTEGSAIFTAGFFGFLLILQLLVALVVGGFSSYLATRKHLNI